MELLRFAAWFSKSDGSRGNSNHLQHTESISVSIYHTAEILVSDECTDLGVALGWGPGDRP